MSEADASHGWPDHLDTIRQHYLAGDFEAVLRTASALLRDEQVLTDLAALAHREQESTFFLNIQDFLMDLTRSETDVAWVQDPYVELLLWCAQSAQALKRFEEAQGYLDRLLRAVPQAPFWHLKARYLQEQDDLLESLEALRQALKQDPQYLPAYEDLITLANRLRLPDLAFALIQQASEIQMTPHLLEELFLLTSETDFVSLRSLFLELCVQQLNPNHVVYLSQLLLRLYEAEDSYHSTYLGFHLLSYGVRDEAVRNAYVLSALRQQQWAQVLQLLLRWPEFERDALFYYHVGQAFFYWQMPRFAREAFAEGLKHTQAESLWRDPLVEARAQCGEEQMVSEDFLKSMIKRMGVDPVFKHRFMAEPEQVLRHYQVSWTTPWQRLWQMLQSTVI